MTGRVTDTAQQRTATDGSTPGLHTEIERLGRRHRAELVGVAYGILGEVAEAEDAVQEALLRLQRRGRVDDLERPVAWLTRVVSRICLDRLRSAVRRREVYVGPWLPEPLVVADDDPTAPVETAEDLSLAFLVVLEALSPAERVAFLLRDVFGHDYATVAATLDRSPAATRQLVARARSAVQARRPRFDPPERSERDEIVRRFVAACAGGAIDPILELLAPDVRLASDGGGVVSAARRPVVGADRVARFLVGLWRKAPDGFAVDLVRVNGDLGIAVWDADGRLDNVTALDVADGRILSVAIVRNPEKLRHLDALRPSASALRAQPRSRGRAPARDE